MICGKWVSQGAGKVIAVASCENSHHWFVRLNYSKNEDGSRRVRRMIYPLIEEREAVYEKCLAAEKEYRKKTRPQKAPP